MTDLSSIKSIHSPLASFPLGKWWKYCLQAAVAVLLSLWKGQWFFLHSKVKEQLLQRPTAFTLKGHRNCYNNCLCLKHDHKNFLSNISMASILTCSIFKGNFLILNRSACLSSYQGRLICLIFGTKNPLQQSHKVHTKNLFLFLLSKKVIVFNFLQQE